MHRLQMFLKAFGGRPMEDLLSTQLWPNFDLEAFSKLRPAEK